MKNIRIPVNLDCASRANEIIKSKIDEIASESTTRKKPSYRQELQKERLQGLLVNSTFNEGDMHKFGNLLEPDVFENKVDDLKKQYASLSKDELASRLAETELELEIEQGFAEITRRALDQLEHIADGDEYRKIKSNDNRQDGRNKNFASDNDYLRKTLDTLIKRKAPNPLTWDDYEIFQHDVHLGQPEPSYKQEVRVVGEAKELMGQDLEIHKDVTKELNTGWSKSRLRDFYTEHTGLRPKSE
jgi:hypothetical protein